MIRRIVQRPRERRERKGRRVKVRITEQSIERERAKANLGEGYEIDKL
jgi:hypothetical protein